MELKTIKVVRKNEPNPETGFVLINEGDFDPAQHEHYKEPKSSAKAAGDKGDTTSGDATGTGANTKPPKK